MNEPTPEAIARILEASPDIRPEMIRQAAENLEYLSGMATSWIINGDDHHGAMLQCLCLAFAFQQTEIKRLTVESMNQRARMRAVVKLADEMQHRGELMRQLDKEDFRLAANAYIGRAEVIRELLGDVRPEVDTAWEARVVSDELGVVTADPFEPEMGEYIERLHPKWAPPIHPDPDHVHDWGC